MDTACRYAYGDEKANILLTAPVVVNGNVGYTSAYVDTSLIARAAAKNRKLWGGKKWIRTLSVWMCGTVPLTFLSDHITIPIIHDFIGVIVIIYFLFPFSYFWYRW